MMNKQQLLKTKEQLEAKKLEKASMSGQLGSEKKKLKEEFGVKSAKEAQAKLDDISKELDEKEEAFTNRVGEFNNKFSELLEA